MEEYSEDISLDGALCALLNGTPTQLPSWCNDKTIKRCHLSQSGMTFKPLTVENGEGVLTSFLEAFLAQTSVVPGREQESTGSKVPCGSTWQELLVKFDRDSSSWRTHRSLFDEVLPESSVTLPKWGMMQNGVLWERTTSAHLTSAIESGLLESWRSPAANEPGITVDRLKTENGKPVGSNCRHYDKETGRMAQIGLAQQVVAKERWPTPRSQEAKHGEPTNWEMQTDHAGTKDSLRVQVAKRQSLWPTPRSRDYKDGDKVPPSRQKNPDLATLGQKVAIDEMENARNGEYGKKIQAALNSDNWPTPSASEGSKIPSQANYGQIGLSNHPLIVGVPSRSALKKSRAGQKQDWHTPTSHMAKEGNYPAESQRNTPSLTHEAAVEEGKAKQPMKLNPDWVEWLMGWPIGWTSIKGITEVDWRDWSVDPADGNEVPRVTSDNTNRVGRLKAIGNGQCPQAAALAFVILSQND